MQGNESIPSTGPTGQTITRRQALEALAILPLAALIPALPPVPNGTPEAPIFHTGLTEPITRLAAFDAYLQELAQEPLASPADAEALYQAYGEASKAAHELDRLLVSFEFEQTILGPLAGGIEQYHAALAIEPDEVVIPVEPAPVESQLSREKWEKMITVLEDVIAEQRAKHLA